MQSSYVVRSQLFLGDQRVPTLEKRLGSEKLLPHMAVVIPEGPGSLDLDHVVEIRQVEIRLILVVFALSVLVRHDLRAPLDPDALEVALVEKLLLEPTLEPKSKRLVRPLHPPKPLSPLLTSHRSPPGP